MMVNMHTKMFNHNLTHYSYVSFLLLSVLVFIQSTVKFDFKSSILLSDCGVLCIIFVVSVYLQSNY